MVAYVIRNFVCVMSYLRGVSPTGRVELDDPILATMSPLVEGTSGYASRVRTTVSPRTQHARRLFAGLPPTYDRMGAALSFGQDPRWRRFMVSRIPPHPAGRVLDVATGTGAVAIHLATVRPGVRIVGLDQSEPMLRRAVERAATAGCLVRFVLGQGERLPFANGQFDAVTFTYLMRYVEDPAATLAELARTLKPGGTLANLEFHVPENLAWRSLWWLYTRLGMPVAGRAVSRDWYEVGRFLGPSISGFYRRHPLAEQLAMWKAAGFPGVRARVMSLGGGVVIWGTKRVADGG
jgi:demethylmenaquinone methyltransferase/2-methoxy-6-polyprenyl-1,4-benzoquinol methylase